MQEEVADLSLLEFNEARYRLLGPNDPAYILAVGAEEVIILS